jgi:para-aminobenzoate synthetase component 1
MREINMADINAGSGPVIPIISYDYKNQVEQLASANGYGYTTKDLVLVQPDFFEKISEKEMGLWLQQEENHQPLPLTIQARLQKNQYLKKVNALMQHIQLGDIYEVNFCMEFYVENIALKPFELFRKYNALSKAPMACYVKYNHLHLIGGSPERFLKKTGNVLLSQPIKGTRKRSSDPVEDARLKLELQNDPKERAENVMIVDLVRNDLSRIAERGSVKVQELCGIYGFEQVYQSISTIACTLDQQVRFKDIVHALFPMGSMTGAPKIRAMQLIEQYETTKRQWYSGSTGYILPNGDFDLNVIIRSMVYDEKNKYLSFEVGSAITAGSQPEQEYEECLVKARAMVKALNAQVI